MSRKRFFTSDSHFGDDRFNFMCRPFKSVKEQEDYIVERWNAVVGPDDEVFHLGDFAYTDEGLEVRRRLNGKIHLITGNYDDPRPYDKLEDLFDSVMVNDILTLKNGEKVWLNHYPAKTSEHLFNIVGHIHGLWRVQRNMINVGVDAWHFNPVSEDELLFYMNGIRVHYDENVFAGELEQNLNHIRGREVYTEEKISSLVKSVFLAGPTPRDLETPSWRPNMVKALRDAGFNGDIIIPETRDPEVGYNYDNQIDWEHEGLTTADLIIFWVPRELEKMPAFTTNIEFGEWMNSGKVVLGYPEGAEKMKYMQYKADRIGIPNYDNMQDIANFVVDYFN
jgi:calcineurin-like phosphoesterase family protein